MPALLISCGDTSFREKTSFKSLRGLQTADTAELEKRAKEYEGDSSGVPKYVNELSNIYYKLGFAYQNDKNWDRAIDAFQKALKYGKDPASCHYNLAVVYGNRGKDTGDGKDTALSEKHYRLALEKNPAFSDARYGLGILLFYEKNNKEEGLALMRQLVEKNRDYIRGYFALGKFYYEMDRPERALAVYEALYAQLERRSDRVEEVRLYKQQCRENIDRLMRELSGKH